MVTPPGREPGPAVVLFEGRRNTEWIGAGRFVITAEVGIHPVFFCISVDGRYLPRVGTYLSTYFSTYSGSVLLKLTYIPKVLRTPKFSLKKVSSEVFPG